MTQHTIHSPSHSLRALWPVLIAAFIILALNSWNAKSCFIPDELFYYKSSQTLEDAGNILAPKYYDEARFQKPPLFYIAVFSAMKIFGVNWFAARIATILASVAVLAVTYLLGRRMFGAGKALYAVIMLATSTLFFRFGRMAIPEMPLVLCMTGAFYFGYRYFTEKRERYFYAAFMVMGAGILVKGPMALLLPGIALCVYYYLFRPPVPTPPLRWVYGVSIALGLGLLWLIPTVIMHGHHFTDHVMKAEISDRFTAGTHSVTAIGMIGFYLSKLLFYVPVVFAEFLPWSVIVPVACLCCKEGVERKADDASRSFLLVWAATGFIAFSLVPAKRMHYVLSFLPALSLYAASFFNFDMRRIRVLFIRTAVVTACVYMITVLAVFPVIFTDGVDRLSMRVQGLAGASGDRVGVAWNLDPQRVELYLDRRIHDTPEHELTAKEFPDLDVSWLLIAQKEYDRYLLPLKSAPAGGPVVTVIAEDWRWRKKIPFWDCVHAIQRDPAHAAAYLRDALQEKIYLLKKGGR